ncbi:MAG TPA: phenylalanine--tRNA ligase subunit beta [Ignavibacteriaceae bacterium]|nr:phenylalanine--tRNA ligase subunit beta [Ignavibacteriaceae bacterium]
MRISLNWLKEYVDLQGIPVSEIVHELTMSGLEVEEYTDQSELFKNIIVGEVKEVQKHPDADKLSVCKVFDGMDELQVICGAPNVEAGQKVVFASVGAVIPNGKMELKKAKIRGVESFGMICAEDELLLSEDHTGIMVLDSSFNPGMEISKALGLDDVIMEIGITPNRPDALSHIGVARDLAAIFNKELKYPNLNYKETDEDINSIASVEIQDSTNCPRYAAKVVKDVQVVESPDWLKKKIIQIGLRPINNIVDVTNFILHELGQPLHAFDLDLLAGQKIIVKSTTQEKKFTTLDSKERILPADTLMICDGEREVAIAGVMGGENSEITRSTKNILIESAYFNPSSIRKTSKKLQLSSDSSYRFERGIDFNNVLFAAERAAQLIAEVSGGKICKGNIDAYPVKLKNREVQLRYNSVSKILGYDIPLEKIHNILHLLGFKELKKEENSLTVSVPGFRPDIEREIDLIEEIARIHGYDNIPTISKINITLGEKHDDSEFADKIRDAAISLGFYEMINNPLVSEKFSQLCGEPIALSNPLSEDMANLRTSLLPGVLAVVTRNINKGAKDLALFEIGNVFQRLNNNKIESFEDFNENQNLIFVLSGKETEKTWNSAEKGFDFYSLKGLLKAFIQKITLDNVLTDLYYSDVNSKYDLNFALAYKTESIGWGGKVKKQLLELFEIDQDVFCFEFNLDKLKQITTQPKKFTEPLKYPKVIRDFAFIFDTLVNYGDVNDYISKSSSSLLKKVDLFDIFESEILGTGKKSMAFTLEFFDENRTLTEEEVEKEFNDLIRKVSKEFNATLRGSK